MQSLKIFIKKFLKFFIRGKLREKFRLKYNQITDKGFVFYVVSYYLFNHILIYRYKVSTCGMIRKYYIGPFLLFKSKKQMLS